MSSRRLTPDDADYYDAPVPGQVYELRKPIIQLRTDGDKIVFTHVRCETQDITCRVWMFEPLRDADQSENPKDYVLRYNQDYVRYGISYERHDMHRHVKLPRHVDDLEAMAIALNTALADAERARKRAKAITEVWIRTHRWCPYGQSLPNPMRILVEVGHLEDRLFVADSAHLMLDVTDARMPKIDIPLDELLEVYRDALRHAGGGWIRPLVNLSDRQRRECAL